MASSELLSSLASQTASVNNSGEQMLSAASATRVMAAGGRGVPTPAQQLTPVPMSSAPQLTHVDGTPAQVNYMGTFDLNSSTLQAVMSGQGITQNTTQMIKDLVQRALRSGGQEVIPGVEVKSAITDTPQGPKKVLRVFINEDILPIQRSPQAALPSSSSTHPTNSSPLSTQLHQPPLSSLRSLPQSTQQQVGFQPTHNIAAVAAASLQPLRRPVASTTSGQNEQQPTAPPPTLPASSTPSSKYLPNWTKLLQPHGAQLFPSYQSKSSTAANNSTAPRTSLEQSTVHRNLKPLGAGTGSNFRRALKPGVLAPRSDHPTALDVSGAKRKQGLGNQDAPPNKRARAVFEKTQLEDGSIAGRLGGLVSRSLELSLPSGSQMRVANSSQEKPPDRSTQTLQEPRVASASTNCPTLLSALQPKTSSSLVGATFDTARQSNVNEFNPRNHPEAVSIASETRPTQDTTPVVQKEKRTPIDMLREQSAPGSHQIKSQQQQLSSLQRASFPNASSSIAALKSSLANRKRLHKQTMKKVNYRKELAARDPGSSLNVPRTKGWGKKGGERNKMKIGRFDCATNI